MFSISSSKNSRKIVRDLYTSKGRHNHYKVLNLSKNCKYKEIKESFIRLSKKHHPDLNKSEDAHEKILKINEAYKVLSNTESRRIYDLGLASSGFQGRNTTNIHYYEQTTNKSPTVEGNRELAWFHGYLVSTGWKLELQISNDENKINIFRPNLQSDANPLLSIADLPWKDTSFYENRDKSQDKYYESKPYYGIDGLKRTTNFKVLMFCLLVATLVVGFQIFAIKRSFDVQMENLIERSNNAQHSLKTIRETANRNGNQVQIELLKQKFAVKDKTE